MFSGTSHKASSSGEIDYSAPMDYPLLDEVTGVDALRKLPVEELPELARELRHFMVRSVAKTGGHLSSSLGAVELAIALHYVFNTPYDRIIWDVGHQAYAHKILTGRREGMATLRKHHLEGENDRWAIAVIGDGALTGGMAIEALNDAGVWKKGLRLLVIVNDNDCSISPPAGALSKHLAKIVSTRAFNSAREMSKRMMKPIPRLWEVAKLAERQTIGFLSPQSALFSAFDINYYGPVDGHDVESLVSVLKNLREMDRPLVLHVATMKGKGYAPAEADPTLYHGVSPFDPAKGIVKSNAPSKPTYTQVFSRWICDMAAHDKRLYAITPAMREGSGLVEFNRLYPDRYRDVAIAEQHSVTYAAGLACGGMKPVLAIYSTFLQRGLDQLIHDVALQNLPVMFAIDRGGIVGADGATHQGVFDIVELRSVPNMTVMTPSDERETRLMLNTAYFMETPASVRYPRGKGPGVEAGTDFETIPIGVSKTLLRGSKTAFLGFGAMTGVLKPVAEALGGTLIDMRFVKPIDRDAILEAARTHELIVTAEEGALMGGAGDAVMEVLADAGVALPVMRFGIPDEFIEQGTQKEIYELLGLTPQAIEAKVRERLAEIESNKAQA